MDLNDSALKKGLNLGNPSKKIGNKSNGIFHTSSDLKLLTTQFARAMSGHGGFLNL